MLRAAPGGGVGFGAGRRFPNRACDPLVSRSNHRRLRGGDQADTFCGIRVHGRSFLNRGGLLSGLSDGRRRLARQRRRRLWVPRQVGECGAAGDGEADAAGALQSTSDPTGFRLAHSIRSSIRRSLRFQRPVGNDIDACGPAAFADCCKISIFFLQSPGDAGEAISVWRWSTRPPQQRHTGRIADSSVMRAEFGSCRVRRRAI